MLVEAYVYSQIYIGTSAELSHLCVYFTEGMLWLQSVVSYIVLKGFCSAGAKVDIIKWRVAYMGNVPLVSGLLEAIK